MSAVIPVTVYWTTWPASACAEPPVTENVWFDVTKADWRASMVLGVEPSAARERLAMWAWDARQQFGVAGLALAVWGAIRLWWVARPWAVLLWLCFSFMYGWVHNAFGGNPFMLTLIDAGQELVAALLTGVIVGALGFRGTRVTSPAVSTAAATA